jgi:cystathionine beta-lyase/cystathionine gamma-synthase
VKALDPTSLQHAGKSHRVGQGLVGATETSVTYQTVAFDNPPVYSRLGNTSQHRELEDVISSIEGAEASIVTGSGMSAFNLLFQSLLRPQDHILVQECCYGGTFNYIENMLKPWGVLVSIAPVSEWKRLIQKNTKLALIESISNPFCIPQDIAAVADLCKSSHIISVCDNTFASPVLCRPLEYGIDVVMESATKYLNGHSDVIAGAISGNKIIVDKLRKIHAYLGTFLPPPQCSQLLRGLKTLELRVRQISENGKSFALAMRQANDVVDQVFYGTENPSVQTQFPQGFGGMVSIKFKSNVDVPNLLRHLKIVADVPSLGGTESTATMPTFTTNWFMDSDAKAKLGIDEKLVRFSIGLERPQDIVNDVLKSARSTKNIRS